MTEEDWHTSPERNLVCSPEDRVMTLMNHSQIKSTTCFMLLKNYEFPCHIDFKNLHRKYHNSPDLIWDLLCNTK